MTPVKRTLRFLLGLALVPILALAQNSPPLENGITTKDQLLAILNNILSYVYAIFFILAAMFILFSAYSFLTAAGDEERLRKAKNRLLYAVVAIVIALVSLSVSGLIANILQPSNTNPSPPASGSGAPNADCSTNPNICGGDLTCVNGQCVFPGQ